MSDNEPLLHVEDLSVEFAMRDGTSSRVIDGLSFELKPGETLGIVGESGCGKSMTALAIMRLVPMPPGRIATGSIRLEGADLVTVDEARMREVRGNDISMVFQEPMTSLNPVYTIGEQIAENDIIREVRNEATRAIDNIEIAKRLAAISRNESE